MKAKKILVGIGVVLVIALIGGLIWLRVSMVGIFEPRCTRPGIQVESIDAYDACIAEMVDRYDLPGMSVALVTADGVAWSKGYGYANIEEGRPATADTPYLLSSITKTFVATAIMQQVEAGTLDLDEDINTYLPFTVDNPLVEGEVITLRDLATHTSGLIDNYDDVYDPSYVPGDSPVGLGEFLEGYYVPGGEYYDPDGNFSEYAPGERRQYSNIGASLAAYTVEVVSGEPFSEYVENHILGPLGMDNSHFFLADYDDHNIIAMPYELNQDGELEAYGYYGYPTYPDGHLYTSANDMGRFLAAIMNDGELDGTRILEAETVDLMLTPQGTVWKPNLSDRILLGKPEQEIFWVAGKGEHGHDGGDYGSFTMMFFEPEHKVGVVMLTNYADLDSVIAMLRLLRQATGNSEHMAALLSQ